LTDITGFGLLGHLRNVTAASAVSAEVWSRRVPVLDAARVYVKEGIAPGGTHANRRFLASWVTYEEGLSEEDQLLLCDAQTSGGLLAAIPSESAEATVRGLREAGVSSAVIIGRIGDGEPGKIRVRLEP
jgi:selenide,water dikinase